MKQTIEVDKELFKIDLEELLIVALAKDVLKATQVIDDISEQYLQLDLQVRPLGSYLFYANDWNGKRIT